MLTTLKIKNYALIRDIEIDFSPGLNILTGETGAGKSIIIGALSVAIGERGYTENIRTGEDKAEVEAVFNIKNNKNLINKLKEILKQSGIDFNEEQLIIKREISRSGKGRIYINNSAVTLSLLETIGNFLVDIHGQHEHQSLLKSELHIEFLDAYAKADDLRFEISTLYNYLIRLNDELNKIYAIEKDKQEKLEIINYKLNELKQADLKDSDEYEKLLTERTKLVNVETIKNLVNNIILSLMPSSIDIEGEGAIDLLAKAEKNINEIEKYDSKTAMEYKAQLNEILIKSKDLKDFFVDYINSIDFDKNYLDKIENRIELIEDLMKKFRKTDFIELINYSKELEKEKQLIELNEEIIKKKETEKKEILKKLTEVAIKLSNIRKQKAEELSKKIEEELKQLSITKAVFKINVYQKEANDDEPSIILNDKKIKITDNGIDNVEFLISLNPGEEIKPLVKVASGGEISRIMLAIKNILSESDIIPVMVFDEIDIGVSGKVASDIGAKLFSISKKKQIICITHLPQIASFSDTHYSVEKFVKNNKTETNIKKLNKDEKIREVAKLISGEKVTETSIKSAEELINSARNQN